MVYSFERSVSILTMIGGPFLLLLLSIETVCNDLLIFVFIPEHFTE